MKRPAWEPMPGRIFDFTERQQMLVGVIEKISRNGFDHLIWYYFKGDRLAKIK